MTTINPNIEIAYQSEEWLQSRREMELSMGAVPLDELQAPLDDTLEVWADGDALFGYGGMYNDLRKVKLAEVTERIRAATTEKCTEKALDDKAHADPEYKQWLENAEETRKLWRRLSEGRDKIAKEERRGDALIRRKAG